MCGLRLFSELKDILKTGYHFNYGEDCVRELERTLTISEEKLGEILKISKKIETSKEHGRKYYNAKVCWICGQPFICNGLNPPQKN